MQIETNSNYDHHTEFGNPYNPRNIAEAIEVRAIETAYDGAKWLFWRKAKYTYTVLAIGIAFGVLYFKYGITGIVVFATAWGVARGLWTMWVSHIRDTAETTTYRNMVGIIFITSSNEYDRWVIARAQRAERLLEASGNEYTAANVEAAIARAKAAGKSIVAPPPPVRVLPIIFQDKLVAAAINETWEEYEERVTATKAAANKAYYPQMLAFAAEMEYGDAWLQSRLNKQSF